MQLELYTCGVWGLLGWYKEDKNTCKEKSLTNTTLENKSSVEAPSSRQKPGMLDLL